MEWVSPGAARARATRTVRTRQLHLGIIRLSLGASVLSTTTPLPSFLFLERAFDVRMWRENACRRVILPVPVLLNRFDAPLCDFSFGILQFFPWTALARGRRSLNKPLQYIT